MPTGILAGSIIDEVIAGGVVGSATYDWFKGGISLPTLVLVFLVALFFVWLVNTDFLVKMLRKI